MKRTASILLVLVILLAGFQAVISTHFCGGVIADTKVSLAGHLATCGMEGNERTCPVSGSNLKSHCCEDQINIAGVVNVFTMPFSGAENNFKDFSNVSSVPINGFSLLSVSSTTSFTNFYPPGGYQTSSVSLEQICVFRI
ncbi:MAG TPA: hypothetical protein VMV74_08475 [Bacteroidales bacterium]|nr:hypothetical protein [Bacteroidales bacterium]